MKRVLITWSLMDSRKYLAESSKYFLGLFLFTLLSCSSKRANNFVPPKIIQEPNSDVNLKIKLPVPAHFPILYIGPSDSNIFLKKVSKSDSILMARDNKIITPYLISTNDLVSYLYKPEEDPNLGGNSRKVDSLNIMVDTSTNFQCMFKEYHEFNGNYLPQNIIRNCFPIFIKNYAAMDTAYVSEHFGIALQIYSEEFKSWVYSENNRIVCWINNYIKIYPGHIVMLPLRRYNGERTVKCRIIYRENIISNEFNMSLDQEDLSTLP